ncbi:hypothetical protein MM440_10625 [Arsenicicoccus piscis]|uniref:General stress protein 17M-like domain-containing protein n=1 Tax=Arsenicicoccus piscis TaxID=673954 RepID=A0ABQ6HIV6_9MICO|nr:general stress protein [Arsenicicoccus piscis]MCH8628218.1 hypothetical protein [Arsenicicoccus piscis]GMA18461.1 hypothetical protein GCM10025862_04820 [Arsenicicoccus piscis]
MSTNPLDPRVPAAGLNLRYPMSLRVFDDYAGAQKAVDYLSDHEFPVENVMIVGTDLKLVERVTGRLTTPTVALGGVLSGLWLGLFVGLIFSLFAGLGLGFGIVFWTMIFGAIFGLIWALIGYSFTLGRRDFTSVQQVVATKYEVLVEQNLHAQAAQLLAGDSTLGGVRRSPQEPTDERPTI